MRKIVVTFCGLAGFLSAKAQLSTGGFPLSFSEGNQFVQVALEPTLLSTPDWDAQLRKEATSSDVNAPYLVALFTPAHVSFPESGTMFTLNDGRRIWKAQVKVAGAPALGLYYDQFNLPKGVKMFVTNENKRQVIGAFTHDNNQASGNFVNEPVQGEVAEIELDIDSDVDFNNITLSINRVAVFHRGIENLTEFVLIDGEGDSQTNGTSSVCMINSICPQGVHYAIQRKATVGIFQPVGNGVGACSGTMINNTGNTPQSCKQYYLSASHCEPYYTNDFTQSIFRYNYEHAACTGGAAQTSKTLIGASLVARNVFTQAMLNNPNTIKADFMLLELNNQVPLDWDIKMAGWNSAANIATTTTAPQKFIGFHHPNGDSKKLSYAQQIQPYTLGDANSHWALIAQEGYAMQGSSGSGLFNGTGQLIGQASVAGPQNVPANCMTSANGSALAANSVMDVIIYSKLSYGWEFSGDGSDPIRRLKPWLDPANSGATSIYATNSICTTVDTNTFDPVDTGTTSVGDVSVLENAVSLFPNPASSGYIQLAYNFPHIVSTLDVAIFDINGRSVKSMSFKNLGNGTKTIELDVPNGMYMVRISNGAHTVSKKVTVAR